MSILNLSHPASSVETIALDGAPSGASAELGPAQAKIIARVRWLMLLSGVATMLGIALVIGIVGYRVYHAADGTIPVEATAALPGGARVVAVGTAGERIVVHLDVGGTAEIRTFDARTLRPAGRLLFASEP